MKSFRFLLALAAAFGLSLFTAHAQEKAPASSAAAELPPLIERVKSQLKAGVTTEAGLAPLLAEFDALLTKHQTEKTEDVAQILLMKAMLYAQVFENSEKATALLRQLKADFPDTQAGKDSERMIEGLESRGKAASLQAALIGQPAPALNFTWSSRPGLKSLADLKGKVVLLDFWATWCGPCIRSFPQIAEVVAHYQGYDVEVVGVTSLQGRVSNLEAQPIDCKGDPAKETGLMPVFMKAKAMTWTVAFSEEPVFNPAYAIEGIPYVTIIAPDGTIRHTGLHPAMPHEEKREKIDAVLKEFGLKVPAAKS